MMEPAPAYEVRVSAAHEVAPLLAIELASAAMVALQLANAADLFGGAVIGMLFFALLWLVAESGFLLVRLLFVWPQGDA